MDIVCPPLDDCVYLEGEGAEESGTSVCGGTGDGCGHGRELGDVGAEVARGCDMRFNLRELGLFLCGRRRERGGVRVRRLG